MSDDKQSDNIQADKMPKDSTGQVDDKFDSIKKRISSLEEKADLLARLQAVEERLEDTFSNRPWWFSGKTVTVLVSIVAAIIPIVTAIDGLIKSDREETRVRLQQQDQIRQTYLNRVLAPGIVEGDRERLYRLLRKLSDYPELKEWAQEEYAISVIDVNKLRIKADSLDKKLKASLHSRDSLVRLGSPTTPKTQAIRRVYETTIKAIQKEKARTEARINGLPATDYPVKPLNALEIDMAQNGQFAFNEARIDIHSSCPTTVKVSVNLIMSNKNKDVDFLIEPNGEYVERLTAGTYTVNWEYENLGKKVSAQQIISLSESTTEHVELK